MTESKKPHGFLSSMDDRKLLDYTISLYGKNAIRGKLQKKDSRLYEELRRRGLADHLESSKGISRRSH